MAATERAFPAAKLPLVSGGDAAAFFPFGTTGEDNLRVTSFGSVAGVNLELSGRLRHPDGRITTFTHLDVASADRLGLTHNYPLGAGVLLNLTLHTTGEQILFGHCFAIVHLIRGFSGGTVVLATLLQGYVTGTQHLGWPGSPIKHTREHGGLVRFVFPANPGAGAALLETVPAGAIWEPIGIRVRLICSAVAGARQVFVEYLTGLGGTGLFYVASPFIAGAGNDFTSNFGNGAFWDNAMAGASAHPQGLPAIEVSQNYALNISAFGLLGGDQISNVVISVREWLEGRT